MWQMKLKVCSGIPKLCVYNSRNRDNAIPQNINPKRPLQELIMEGHAMMATLPTSASLRPQIQSKHEVCCLYLLSHAIISWLSSSVS